MEEYRVARFHLTFHPIETFFRFGDSLEICPGLFPSESVIDPPHAVRPFQYFEASVFRRCRIDRDHDTTEVGKKEPVLIPISIVLMPGPGSTDQRIL